MIKLYEVSAVGRGATMYLERSFEQQVEALLPKQYYADSMYGMCYSVQKPLAKFAAPVAQANGFKTCEAGCVSGECVEEVVELVL